MKLSELNKEKVSLIEPSVLKLSDIDTTQIKPVVEDKPNYFERVGGAYDTARKEIVSGIKEGAQDIQEGNPLGGARAGLRTAGAFAKSVFAPILEAPGIKQATEFVVGKALESSKIQDVVTGATLLAQKYPTAAKDIEDVVNIVSLGYAPKVGGALSKEGRAIIEDSTKLAKQVLTPSEQAVQADIVELFQKSIKPTHKKTQAQADRYENDVVTALKTIKANVDDLNIEDDIGELVSGRTPQSINEMSQALHQTKSLVFSQYDDLARRAGTSGATISTKPVVDELLNVSQSRALQLTNPEVIKYAENWADRLSQFDILDTTTVQEVLKIMNKNLESFYRNPTYDSASKVAIDAGIANNFRKLMDEAIETATGEQYQQLKNMYGALKAIENDVVRAAMRDARKNTKGILDYTDIFTGGQMIGGVLSLNPAMFTKGAVERGFKEWFKYLNDPNRAVSNMFDLLDTSTVKPIKLNLGGGSGLIEAPETKFQPKSATFKYLQKPKVGLSIEDVSEQGFKNFNDLSTKLLSKLEGRTKVSKQFIEDLTNSPDLKQAERDLFRNILKDEGGVVDVPTFANKVKSELLPLKRVDQSKGGGVKDYENIALPSELRGPVANYSENIYNSPIKTSAGEVHFPRGTDNYFAHTRIEDLPDSKKFAEYDSGIEAYRDKDGNILDDSKFGQGSTRRVIEIQSDLFQKGRLESEVPYYEQMKGGKNIEATARDVEARVKAGTMTQKEADEFIEMEKKAYEKIKPREQEIAKLEPYRNTWHERVIREEVKKAAQDGKTKLQFPTGETAMKIEGLGQIGLHEQGSFMHIPNGARRLTRTLPEHLKISMTVVGREGDSWVITDVLEDGKFKAVPKKSWDGYQAAINNLEAQRKGEKALGSKTLSTPESLKEGLERWTETFDISGKVDTNNPIYKFYEKEVGRYLQNKYKAQRIKDAQGVEWWEVKIDKKMSKLPIEAFGVAPLVSEEE